MTNTKNSHVPVIAVETVILQSYIINRSEKNIDKRFERLVVLAELVNNPLFFKN